MHAHSRLTVLALLGIAVLLLSACDTAAPPLTIENQTTGTISVSLFFKDAPRPIGIVKQAGGSFRGSLDIAPEEALVILISGVSPSQFTLVVKDTDSNELFQQTFLNDELDARDWRIIITPEGIQ